MRKRERDVHYSNKDIKRDTLGTPILMVKWKELYCLQKTDLPGIFLFLVYRSVFLTGGRGSLSLWRALSLYMLAFLVF